jgi:hypothetical protein
MCSSGSTDSFTVASATGNSTYNNAAIFSADFIEITDVKLSDIVLGTVDVQNCTHPSLSWLFRVTEQLRVCLHLSLASNWTSL